MPTPKPRQSTGLVEPYAPDPRHGADDRPAVVHWQSLVERRLIGTTAPLSAATLASIAAAEAVLCPRRTGGVW